VVDKDIERLWAEDRMAIHFLGNGPTDLESLDLKDYPQKGNRTAVSRFGRLAQEGGYVWSPYRDYEQAKVGFVERDTKIQIMDATWDDRNPGRPAKLKTLQLKGAQTIEMGEWMSLRVATPRQGTISRWKRHNAELASIVDGKTLQRAWQNLSPPVQEIVCTEFLRCHDIEGLPKLKWLLLPVGRTMKDVDIYGLTTGGKKLFAQVTFLKKHPAADQITNKIKKLGKYQGSGAQLIMFCRCDVRGVEGDIYYVPVETDVFKWLENNQDYASLCFSGS